MMGRLLPLLAVWLIASPAAAAVVVIDDFNHPVPADRFFISGPAGLGDPNPTLIQASGPGIMGGQRDVLIEVVGTAHPASANGLVGFDLDFNLGALQLQTHAPGTSATLQYDGPDVEAGTLTDARGLSTDFSFGGLGTGIVIDFLSVDTPLGPGLTLDIVITSSAGGTAAFSDVIPENAGPLRYMAPFSAFTTSGPFSLSAVDSATFAFNGVADPHVDFEIDQIGINVIPEPSSAVLFGLVLCYPAAQRWARRRRPARSCSCA